MRLPPSIVLLRIRPYTTHLNRSRLQKDGALMATRAAISGIAEGWTVLTYISLGFRSAAAFGILALVSLLFSA